MPQTYRITLSDGRSFNVTTEGGAPSEQDVLSNLDTLAPAPAPKPAQPPETSGGPTLALGAGQLLPSLGRGAARFAAEHPAGIQKALGAGVSSVAGGIGGAVGGVPGAVVGASIRGVTPAQTTIRRVAGELAGEAPRVADNAAKALAIQNYAKETNGLKLVPSDIIPKPNPSNALESYANSMERGILRLYGPNGEVVSGPSAVSRIPTTTPTSTMRGALRTIGKVLTPLSIGAGVTDVAQAVEPNRHDIGVMGIGRPWHPQDMTQEEYDRANPTLVGALRAAILSKLGLASGQ